MNRPPYFDNITDNTMWWVYRTMVCREVTWLLDKYYYDGYLAWMSGNSHEITLERGLNYFCRHCRLMGSQATFLEYPCMTIKKKEEAKLKLQVYSGGMDGEGDWLMGLPKGSVFTCLPTKDPQDYMLAQFHVMNKWGRNSVYLMSNFPMHQQGEFLVHSTRFSQLHTLVDILQDGEEDNIMPKELQTQTVSEHFGVD